MISITAYRASIGGFYSTTRNISYRKKSNLSHYDLAGNICIKHQFIQYFKLFMIKQLIPCWIQYFDIFANTNTEDILLSGDVARNPGPTNDFVNMPPPRLFNGASNICFANSSMQLLMAIPSFQNYVKNVYTPAYDGIDKNLQRIIATINDPSKERTGHGFDCRFPIQRIMTFMDGMELQEQHDAHEFLSQLFAKTSNSHLESLFRIDVHEIIVCHSQKCGNAQINEYINSHVMLQLSLTGNGMLTNIADLLQTYFADSSLTGYTCQPNDGEGCSQKGTCIQSQRVVSLSDNLILQLKTIF